MEPSNPTPALPAFMASWADPDASLLSLLQSARDDSWSDQNARAALALYGSQATWKAETRQYALMLALKALKSADGIYSQQEHELWRFPTQRDEAWPEAEEAHDTQASAATAKAFGKLKKPKILEHFAALLLADGADPWFKHPQFNHQDAWDLCLTGYARGIVQLLWERADRPAAELLDQRKVVIEGREVPWAHAAVHGRRFHLLSDLLRLGLTLQVDALGRSPVAYLEKADDLNYIHQQGWLPTTTQERSALVATWQQRTLKGGSSQLQVSTALHQLELLQPQSPADKVHQRMDVVMTKWFAHPYNEYLSIPDEDLAGASSPDLSAQERQVALTRTLSVARSAQRGDWMWHGAQAMVRIRASDMSVRLCDDKNQPRLKGWLGDLLSLPAPVSQMIVDHQVRPDLPQYGVLWLSALSEEAARKALEQHAQRDFVASLGDGVKASLALFRGNVGHAAQTRITRLWDRASLHIPNDPKPSKDAAQAWLTQELPQWTLLMEAPQFAFTIAQWNRVLRATSRAAQAAPEAVGDSALRLFQAALVRKVGDSNTFGSGGWSEPSGPEAATFRAGTFLAGIELAQAMHRPLVQAFPFTPEQLKAMTGKGNALGYTDAREKQPIQDLVVDAWKDYWRLLMEPEPGATSAPKRSRPRM